MVVDAQCAADNAAFWQTLFHLCPPAGDWVASDPTGCASRCGIGAGMSGTPGTVNCTTSTCDPDAKPDSKECPKTVDCGA